MKKKIMGVILAATLIVSQAVTAFAGSKTELLPVKRTEKKYKIFPASS